MRGKIKALKEWNEGYEDLEAIAFSFVVEFKDDNGCWSMYADSEEEKVRVFVALKDGNELKYSKFKILGLFKVAGGL